MAKGLELIVFGCLENVEMCKLNVLSEGVLVM